MKEIESGVVNFQRVVGLLYRREGGKTVGGATPDTWYTLAMACGVSQVEFFQIKAEALQYGCVEWCEETGKFFQCI